DRGAVRLDEYAVRLCEAFTRVERVVDSLVAGEGEAGADAGADSHLAGPSLRTPVDRTPGAVVPVCRDVMAVLVGHDRRWSDSIGGIADGHERLTPVTPEDLV